MRLCPQCDSDSLKVIYMGLPMRLCSDENCSCVFGFWSFIMPLVPFNGVFMTYEGPYIVALMHWIKG